jgi:DNA-binding ferritin-like protein
MKAKIQPNTFASDVAAIRERARRHMDQGAVTDGYRADRATVVRILNEALATELCVLRYRRHYYMASGIHAQAVGQEFLQHAEEEQAHADQIAKRIVQLGLSAESWLSSTTKMRRGSVAAGLRPGGSRRKSSCGGEGRGRRTTNSLP